jgi:single-stranded DNA-binding protein
LSKGDYVEVEGRIQENTWVDKEGHKRSRLELVVAKYQVVQRKQSPAQAA